MPLNLAYKLPVLNKINALKNYQKTLDQIEFEIDAVLWIALSIGVFILVTVLAYFFTAGIQEFFLIGITLAIVIGDLMLGYPYLKASQRIDNIEENLPDVLKQVSDTLKAGGTIEFALREVANSEYGPLKKELLEILRKLEEGENFQTALMTLSENVNSRTIQRTVTIIIDSIKAGAGLADILEEISDDVRDTHKIAKERKTRTLLQVIFLVAAGGLIGPAIFGFVGTISKVLLSLAASTTTPEKKITAEIAAQTISQGMQIYLFIQVIAASVMIALMREGKITKTIIYFPILLFIATLCYVISGVISRNLVGV